jgi:phosphatidylserine decarboxylase
MIITRFGLPQVLLFPLLILLLMTCGFILAWGHAWLIPLELILGAVLLWGLAFFRDPPRKIPVDEYCLLSPADGRVTDVGIIEESPLGTRALRIGIFLSIFNVHINRAPCPVQVESVVYKKGAKISALSPEAGKVNEANNIFMRRLADPPSNLLVRQISGAIARHIVCEARPGHTYRQGEAFGMIKFGSRTELYVACGDSSGLEIAVQVGDKVKAGISPLVRYRNG